MHLEAIDWLIIVAVPLTAWALAAHGRNKAGAFGTFRGYFLALGRLSTTSVAATYIGANLTFTSIFLILSLEAHKRGAWVLSVPFFWIIGTGVTVAVYPRMRPHIERGRTLHQTLGDVFNSPNLQRWAATWTIVAFVGTVALEFYGAILLISWAGVPLLSTLIIAMALAYVVAAFTISGGMRGIARADIFLDVVTFGGALILAVAVAQQMPLRSIPRAALLPVLEDQWLFVLSMGVLFIPFQVCTLDSWQRLLAWREKPDSPGRWLWSGGAALAAAYCIPVFLGVVASAKGLAGPTSVQPLEAILHWIQLSPVLLGVCVAGFLGAVLSTCDELLNCASMALLTDLWDLRLGEQASPAESARYFASGKFYTGLFALVSAGLAVLAVWFGRAISDLALALFSAQVAFAWPLGVALFAPNAAPSLARSASAAMAGSSLTAIGMVAGGWMYGSEELTAAAPIGAFVVAGLITSTSWAVWRVRQHLRRSV